MNSDNGEETRNALRDEEGRDAPSPGSGDQVNWPTVLTSVGISALVCSGVMLVTSLVLVNTLGSESGEEASFTASSSQTADNAADYAGSAAQASAIPPAQSLAAAASRVVKPQPQKAVESVSGSGRVAVNGSRSTANGQRGGAPATAFPAPAVEVKVPMEPAPAPVPKPAPRQVVDQVVEQVVESEPQALSAGEVQAILSEGLGGSINDSGLADRLEGGAAAVPTIRQVGSALRMVGPLYQWRITEPISVEGTVMTVTFGSKLPIDADFNNSPMTFRWMDGQWKLTNQSVCFLAQRAYATCTV